MSEKEKQPPPHPAVRTSGDTPPAIDHPDVLKRGETIPLPQGDNLIDASNAAEMLRAQIAADRAQGLEIPKGFDIPDKEISRPPAPEPQPKGLVVEKPKKVVPEPETTAPTPTARPKAAPEKLFSMPIEAHQMPMSDEEYEATKARLLLEGFTLATIERGFATRRKAWAESQGKKKPKST